MAIKEPVLIELPIGDLTQEKSVLMLKYIGEDFWSCPVYSDQFGKDNFDFTQLTDFRQIMNDNIYTWYADTEGAKLWRPVLDHITFMEETEMMPINTNNPFAGKSIVATGKLENYTRSGIQDRLLELGAKPSESVSKKTDYLIVGENAGGKLDKARALGVTTLTEQEFEAMACQASACSPCSLRKGAQPHGEGILPKLSAHERLYHEGYGNLSAVHRDRSGSGCPGGQRKA